MCRLRQSFNKAGHDLRADVLDGLTDRIDNLDRQDLVKELGIPVGEKGKRVVTE
jgi:hypothetical protein